MRTLVVYYSRSGNTKNIAEMIGKQLGSDLEGIIDHKNRKGLLGFLASGNEAYLQRRIPIEKLKKDPSQYDLIIIGTPIWAGNISTPVSSFLKDYREIIEKFAFFSTGMGSDPQKTFLTLEKIMPHKPVAEVNIGYQDIKKQYHLKMIDKFVTSIKQYLKEQVIS